MTSKQLDQLIEQLRAADRAAEEGRPHLACLYTTLVRATMTRAGLRYADARHAKAIDRAIDRAMVKGES